MVFEQHDKNNLHYYGDISIVKHRYEFYLKKQKGKIYYDTAFGNFGNLLLDNGNMK